MNTFKTALLLTVLTLILVFLGEAAGGKNGMIIAIGLAFVMNFISYWFSDKIVLKLYGAQQIAEADNPRFYNLIRNLALKAALPMPKVYIIPTDTPNAFATGRNPENAAVAATEGILRILSDDEIEGVMAHELSHVKNRDILVSTVVATIAGAISFLASMARWSTFFMGRSSDDDDGGNIVSLIVMSIVAPIAAMLIQLAISRSREYLADEGGARISHKPLSLANALRKIHMAAESVPMNASPATAHMFIVNPLTAKGLMALFSTHPPVEERIARLEEIARGRFE